MENIRSIKQRIQSCMSCNESQCSKIKERLGHHVMSHHSSFKQSATNIQQMKPIRKNSGVIFLSTSKLLDDETSTSDLNLMKEPDRNNVLNYKEVLRPAILECIKNIFVDQNGIHENQIQNIINEFIEKIIKIYIEHNDNTKLENVIDNFLSSLPLSSEKHNKRNMSNLKNKILNKINDFHKSMKENKIDTNRLTSRNTSTESIDSLENFEKARTQNSEAKHLIKSLSGSDESLPRFHSKDDIKISKKMIDKSVQHSFTDIITNENNDLKEINFKKIILNWLFQLNKEGYLHITNSTIESIMKELYKHTRSLLTTKVYKPNMKLLLKGEIISILSDYVTPKTYSSQLNQLAENLAILLLSEKSNIGKSYLPKLNTYFFNEAEQMIGLNDESETNLKPLLLEIVNNNLASYGAIGCNSLNKDITEILSENLHLIYEGGEHHLENKLLELLTFSKDLPDLNAKDITNSIIKQVRNVTATDNNNYTNNKIKHKDNWCLGNSVSVYMSENELYRQANSSSISISKQKSSIIKKKPSHQNTNENIFTEKLTDLMTAWINTLPNKRSNSKDIKIKGNLISNLIGDILDQVKLEQIAPETSNEKDKYISFFIFRWLNRYEIFETIDEAKPYVEQLTERIKEISVPVLKRSKISNNKSFQNILLTNDQTPYTGHLLSFQDIDVLISVILNWFNEQRPSIFLDVGKSTKEKSSRELAMKLLDNTVERSPEQVEREINDWLKKIINPEKIQNVSSAVNTLLKKLETSILNFYHNNKINFGYECHNSSCHAINFTNSFIETTLRELISKYLEFNNDTNSSITRGAITKIFKNELNQLSFPDFDEKILTTLNFEDLFEDNLKLETCVLGLYKEIHKRTNRNLTSLNKTGLTNKFPEVSSPNGEIIRCFSLKATYAKEISEWLNNFPLLPLTDKTSQDHLITMISDLAEKMSESYHDKVKNPSNTRIDTELTDYVTNWIFELPLDTSKEIVLPVVIQQILSRMEQISGAKLQEPYHTHEATSKSREKCTRNMYKYSQSKTFINQKNQDPAEVIVETIEKWCYNLPVKTENEDISRTLKEKVASKLYQKLVELNMNPKYFNNNLLYEEILSEEIDLQLQSLPQNSKLQSSKNELKEQLLEVIIEQRKQIREKASGAGYKQDLEKTIDMSISYSIPVYQENSAAFKMYRDRLANMFILENFDHSNQAAKLNYVKRLQKETEKCFTEIQAKHSIAVAKDSINNELYGALFNVPLPNESSLTDEVEEIKTRCEIDDWFESLPLREVTDMGELLKWDQILIMLAKRLHEMEKYEQDPDNKMHKEITKWLSRLPLLPHQTNSINSLANDLQRRLKSTYMERKHVKRNSNESNQSVVSREKSVIDFRDSNRHSRNLEFTPLSLLPKCCQISSVSKSKKSADKILEIVEFWCQELPLPANTPQERDNVRLIKDNLLIKIIMKINELNMNPETFEDDFMYDELFDDELEQLMSNLPASYEFIQSKNERKNQLKVAIKSIKSVIKDEKARYEYKLQLKNTVSKVLKEPYDNNVEKTILFNTLREDIADSFIVYSFNDDDKSKQICKTLVYRAVEKYFSSLTVDDDNNTKYNSLMIGNQLLCELNKVPSPGEDIIRDEIKELKIKFELTMFFDNIFLAKDTNKLALKTQIKSTLARRLSDASNVNESYQKMKHEIVKSLKKIDDSIDIEKVDQFIKRIKSPEFQNETFVPNIEQYITSSTNIRQTQRSKDLSINEKLEDNNSKRNTKDEPWQASYAVNPENKHQKNRNALEQKLRKTLENIGSPKEQIIDHTVDESQINYKKFEDNAATSSLSSYDQDIPQTNKPYGRITITPNQNITFKTKSSHRLNLDIDITNNQAGNEYTQSNEFQQDLLAQERNLQLNIPKSRTLESPYMFNQYTRKQTTLVRSPQIPSQIQIPDQREILSSPFMPCKQPCSPIKRQAAVQETGCSVMPSPQTPRSSDEFPNSYQNIREHIPTIPSPFMPSTSRCISERPVSYSRRIPPCRRPSTTICRPTDPQGCDNEESHILRGCNAKNPECKNSEDELGNNCECNKKRKRQKVCSVHMKRHCNICNGAYSYQYRMPPYRYQDFYYY